MADPVKPDIDYSYTGFQQATQDRPFPGTQLDSDLAELKRAADDTIDALSDVRRADGKLNNKIVTTDSLADGVLVGVEPPAAWATATAYFPPATVTNGSGMYRCVEQHVSGVFTTDLAAGKWELIFTLQQGPKGDTGDVGPQGEQGPQGDTGPAGSDATVNATNVAAAGAAMATAADASAFGFVLADDDTLASASATKLALSKNVKAFVQTWAGPSAPWNGATAYVAGDKVSYGGAIWQANADNTNKEPGVATEWDEFIPPFTGGTLTDPLVLAASTANGAGLVLTAGAAPTTPAEGEVWRIGTSIVIRIAGGNYSLPFTGRDNEWFGSQKFSSVVKRKTGSLTLANGVNVGPTLPTAPFVRITGPTAAFSIASLTGVYDGQDVELYNTTAQVMTIKHQDSTDETTSPFKRIICPGGADITATVVRLHYDETATSRWIVTSYR